MPSTVLSDPHAHLRRTVHELTLQVTLLTAQLASLRLEVAYLRAQLAADRFAAEFGTTVLDVEAVDLVTQQLAMEGS